METHLLRSFLTSILLIFTLGGCDGGSGDTDASLETSTPKLNTRPIPPPSLDDGFPPVAADDPPPVAEADSAPQGQCDPNYTPCVPIASDVDCAGGTGNGPAYVAGPVRVVGSDPYGLDGNGDGVGCEN